MEHDSDDGEDFEKLAVNSPPVSDIQQLQSSTLKCSSALFLLKAKEISPVSQIALDSIVSDVTEGFQIWVNKLKHTVKSVIQHSISAQVSHETMTAIDRLFNQEEILRPFLGLNLNTCKRRTAKKSWTCWYVTDYIV